MKILHLVDTLWLGGAQSVIKGIFKNQRNNSNIFLYSLRDTKYAIPIEHKNIFSCKSSFKYTFRPLKEIRKIIKRYKIEVLHCHLPRSIFFGYLLKTFYFPHIKLVFHKHGLIHDNWFFQKVIKIIKNKADLFIVVSESTRDKLIEKSGVSLNKISVLYNYVDSFEFGRNNITWDIKSEKSRLHLGDNDFIVGYAGRLYKRKGWREFVKAAIILKNEENIKFVIAGDGPNKRSLNRIINRNYLSHNVKYVGNVKKMVHFYSVLDCFVLPSHWEGLPIVQLEAMAMELPIVSCNGPGMAEVPEKDDSEVLFVNVKSPQEIADKIIYLKANPEIGKKLGENALKKASVYNITSYLKNLEIIYQKLETTTT
jgi:glycosyltransferase involved in cell wall biosynthesis